MQPCFKFKYSALTVAVLSSYATVINAQTVDNLMVNSQLPTVVVTASRLSQTVADSIANTSVITRGDIERSGAVDLPTLLLTQAGIEFGRNGGVGQASSIFMRGMPSRNTLVLVDGVAINTQNDGAPNLSVVDLELIERIEIVRGNVSAAYGSNASGGVIQIFTKHAHLNNNGNILGNVTVVTGTPKQGKFAANLNTGTANTGISVGVSRSSIDNNSAQRVDQNKRANPDLDGSAQTTARLAINHRVSDQLRLGVQAFSTKKNTQYDSSSTKDDRSHTRFSHLNSSIDWTMTPNQLLQIKVGEQRENAVDTKDQISVSNSQNRRQIASIQNTWSIGEKGSVLLAIEQESARFASESFGTYGSKTALVERNLNALLVGWQDKKNGFGWNANLRRDSGAGHQVNTYAVGVSYDITPKFSVRVSQATAFNRPTLGQIYQPIYGNLLLVPEESRNKEVGVQWQTGKNLLRLTAFRAKIDNQFGFNPLTYQTINIDKTSNQGLELLAEMPMPWNSGVLRLGFNSHRPINAITGQALARRAKQQLHVNLSGAKAAWSWGINANYVASRNDTNYNGFPYLPVILKSYVKLDTHIAYALNRKSNISLGLNNLTRVQDASAYSYSGTPRSAVLRFNYTL